jgi:hypothetical protein
VNEFVVAINQWFAKLLLFVLLLLIPIAIIELHCLFNLFFIIVKRQHRFLLRFIRSTYPVVVLKSGQESRSRYVALIFKPFSVLHRFEFDFMRCET